MSRRAKLEYDLQQARTQVQNFEALVERSHDIVKGYENARTIMSELEAELAPQMAAAAMAAAPAVDVPTAAGAAAEPQPRSKTESNAKRGATRAPGKRGRGRPRKDAGDTVTVDASNGLTPEQAAGV